MRRVLDHTFTALCAASALVVAGLVVVIASELVGRGAAVVDWRFLTRPTAEAGAAGGIVYQILGTAILVATALGTAVPLAIAIALARSLYWPRARRAILVALATLNGVPSILFGVFGLFVFVRYLEWGKSWLAGGLLLGAMILPTVATALAERLDAVSGRDLEAAAGLGLTRAQIAWSVLLRQSWGGLFSGALLGLARAAGETAPILFAAAVFSGATMPAGVRESPVLALPYHVFTLAQDAFRPELGARLWGSALVLVALVVVLGLLALPARLRAHDEANRG